MTSRYLIPILIHTLLLTPLLHAQDQVSVWISEGHTAEAGQSITIPIVVGQVEQRFRVNSFELELLFDDTLLDYQGLDLTGSLIDGWNLVVDNEPTPGRILISAADTNLFEISSDSDAILLNLTFNVPPGATPAACTALTLEPSGFSFNLGSPTAVISNGQFCVAATPPPIADLSLTQVATPNPANNGQVIALTATVHNSGPDTATGVTVDLPIAAGLTYNSDDGAGTLAADVWTVPSISSGSSASLTIQLTFNGTADITQIAEIATADPGDPDSTPGNGNDQEDDFSTLIIATPEADLRLSNRVSNIVPFVGDSYFYTLTLTNDGPHTATNIDVSAILPAGLTTLDSTGDGNWNGATWTLTSLAANTSADLNITVRAESAGSRDFITQITSADQPDPDSTPNNSDANEDDQDSATITARSVEGASITIRNDDSNGEGLSDETPAEPIGGNPGTTLGQQRLNALQRAATIWASFLISDIEIVVSAQFNPCPSDTAPFAQIQPFSNNRNFTNAPVADAWYPVALANTIAGLDLNNTDPEITAVINTDLSCLGQQWYLGLDANPPPGQIDLVSVLVAELARGLGFTSLARRLDGSLLFGTTDIFSTFVKDTNTGEFWSDMSSGERITSLDSGNLVWTGSRVITSAPDVLNEGVQAEGIGLANQNADSLFQLISGSDQRDLFFLRWGDTLNPVQSGQLGATAPNHDPGLLVQALFDLGWLELGQSDLRLAMSVDNDAAVPGETVVFTLTATNDGPEPATGVQAVNLLPGGFTYSSHSGDGSYNDGNGLWNIGSLTASNSATLTITAIVNDGGLKKNSAEITAADQGDPDSSPNNGLDFEDDYAAVSVGAADLSLTLEASTLNPNQGDQLTLTITVTNNGPDLASGVEVTDLLSGSNPAPLAYISDDSSDYNPNTGIWDLGNLLKNESRTLQITVQMNVSGSISNTAQVSAADVKDPDSTPANNIESEDDQQTITLATPVADLALTASLDNDRPFSGQNVTLTLDLQNLGPDNASEATVDLSVPAGLTFLSSTGNYSNGSWQAGAIPSGDTTSIDITFTVNQTGSQTITAEVSASNEYDPDSTPGNGVAGEDDQTAVTLTTPIADLQLSVAAFNRTANVGDIAGFLLDITNNGPDPATNVSVSDLIPAGLTYLSNSGDGAYTPGSWTVGDIPVGATRSLEIAAEVTIPGTKVYTAEISAADQQDPDSTPNNGAPGEDDSGSVTIGKADLSLAIAVNEQTPFVGNDITFTLTLANAGIDDATGVTVKADLPAGLDFVSTNGAYNNGIWTVGTLNANQNAQLTITAAPASIGPKTFAAEVLATDHADPDSTPNNGLNEDDRAEITITPKSEQGATIVIVNGDGPGEGFNDTRAVTPTGGNTGTTLGEQRLIAFQHAADIWGSQINSDVTIHVLAKFDPLTCSASSGVLGSAGPKTVARDFPGATRANTWYHAALANALSGADQNGSDAEIIATFNASIDNNNGCLSGTNWYYGIDGAGPSNSIDLVTVLLHELGHGLGFSAFVNPNGQRFLGRDDIFMSHLEDNSRSKSWPDMSDSERFTSGRDTNDLVWNGSEVKAASGVLSTGANSQGEVEMYAPGSYAPGSSVSHFSTRLAPNELMEPFHTGTNHDPGLSVQLLNDLGWASRPTADLALALTASNLAPEPDTQIDITIQVTNNGPGAAGDIEVSAPIPSGLSYVSSLESRGNSFDQTSGTWTIGDLQPGQSATLTLTVSINQNEDITFTAQISDSDREDPNSIPNNNDPAEDDQQSITIEPTRLTATVFALNLVEGSAGPQVVQSNFNAVATIFNLGAINATNVVGQITADPGLEIVSAADPSFNLINATEARWAISSIATPLSFVDHVSVKPISAGTHNLTLTILSAEQEFDPVQETIQIIVLPDGEADLSLSVTASNLAPDPGENVTFTLEVDNDGPDLAEGVQVAVATNRSAAFVSSTGDGAYDSANLTWTIGDLASGSSASIDITLTIDGAELFDLFAEVSASAQFDPDSTPSNGQIEDDRDSVRITPRSADLALSLTLDQPTALVDDQVIFTIYLENNGPDSATPTVSALLPSGLGFVSASSGAYDDLSGVWSPGLIASGDDATLQITASVDTTGSLTLNAAIATSDRFDPDSTPGGGQPGEDDQDSETLRARSANGATIVIVNADSPGEGFNDPTPATPTGGNPGTTLGQQRLNAFQHAADIWGALINSDVTIHINANFDPLTCSAGSAVLGAAGPQTVARDFPGAEHTQTWHHAALANALAGTDLNGGTAEIRATFNASIDNNSNCLSGTNWYYGLDGAPGRNIDLVAVLLHEFGHGLGFSTFVDGTTGRRFFNLDDIYMKFLKDSSTGKNWPGMSDAERANSALDNGDLVWDGPNVTRGSGQLTDGVNAQGETEMYAPTSFARGSSVSHFSTALSPNELMEPFYTGPNHDPGLALNLLLDQGWTGPSMADLSLIMSVDNPAAIPGQTVTFTLSVTNDGPENADITVLDQLPSGLLFAGATGDGSYDDASGVWTIGALSAGATATHQLSATVQASGDKRNIAEILSSNRIDPDSTPNNADPLEDDRAEAGVGSADLELNLTVSNAQPNLGDVIELSVTVQNDGPDQAEDIRIDAPIPAGLTITQFPPQYFQAGAQLRLATLGSGNSQTMTFRLRVDGPAPLDITAQILAASVPDPDSSPANGSPAEDDQDTITITPQVPANADISLTAASNDSRPLLGEPTSVIFTVRNDGTHDATGVSATIAIPAGYDVIDSFGFGTFDPVTGLWTIGDLENGRQFTSTIVFTPTVSGATEVSGEISSSSLPDPDSTPSNGATSEDDYAAVTILPRSGSNAIILIANADGPNEGFNDPTPTTPVGGNTGTTLGQQRLIAFQYAADIWGALLESDVEIVVQAKFDALACSSGSGVLGAAGPANVARDFPNAPHADTWYHQALANALAGTDLNGSQAEITATFNASIDNNNNCLSGTNWYYGLDRQPGGNIDLVDVLIHEFGHGLGFSTFVNSNGQRFFNRNDSYMRNLYDEDTGKLWPAMTDGERRNSAVNTSDLLWDGPEVTAATDILSAGTGSGGRARMFAPNPYQSGSSVSHFDTAMAPNELMEPFYTGPTHDPSLALQLLIDQGWNAGDPTAGKIDLELTALSNLIQGGAISDPVSFTFTLTNNGPETASGIIVDALLPGGITYVSDDGVYNSATGEWTPGDLISGASATITINATLARADVMSFTAQVAAASPDDIDSTPGNDIASEDDHTTITIEPDGSTEADLQLSLLVGSEALFTGQSTQYFVQIDNLGPATANDVQASMILPNAVSHISNFGEGSYDPNTGIWDVGSIAPDGSAELVVIFEANDEGTIINSAEITRSDRIDPDSTPNNGDPAEDDYDTTTFQATNQPAADISLQLSVDNATPFIDSSAVFQLTITNSGPEATTGLVTEITLPSGLDLIQTSGPGTFAADLWSLDALASGTSQTLQIEAIARDLGTQTLQAQLIASDLFDPDSFPNNNASSEDDQTTVSVNPRTAAGARAIIVIDNADAPGEGFNDPTPVTPTGGNAGTTLGEQRLIAFQYAADIWGALIRSDVEIHVEARFDALTCSSGSGVLGSAGPRTVSRDFPGAIASETWHHAALANALAGTDLNGGTAEIVATFNSSIDNNNNCLSGTNWYYGLDRNPGRNIDLVAVLLHELGHGLGFSTFVNPSGQKFFDRDDVYMRNLENHATNKAWPAMSNSERAASAVGAPDLHWTGPAVTSASSRLTSGKDTDGDVEMFAPNPYQGGSSVSHFSTSLSPNELMEPYYTGPNHDPGLAAELLADIGWPQGDPADLSLTLIVNNATPNPGDTISFTLTLSNDGPADASGVQVGFQPGNGLNITADSGDGTTDAGSWLIGNLANGASVTREFTVDVASGGLKTFSAQVTAADQRDPDSAPNNNIEQEDDQATLNVGSADLALQLTSNAPVDGVLVDNILTYNLTLTNQGPDTATSVQITGVMPAEVTYISHTNGQDYQTGAQLWTVPSIDSGQSITLQINTRVISQATFTYEAQVTASDLPDPDSTPANDIQSEDDHATIDVVSILPPPGLEIGPLSFSSISCPGMSVQFTVSIGDQPVTTLDESHFTLYEDGQPLGVTLAATGNSGEYELAYETLKPDGQFHTIDLIVNDGTQSDAVTSGVFNCHISGVTEIFNGDLIEGLGGGQGGWRYFKINLPANQGGLDISIFGGQGDADLYLRHGELPTLDSFDQRPLLSGNDESIHIDSPLGGDWFIGVHALQGYAQLSLTAAFTGFTASLDLIDIFTDQCPDITARVALTLNGQPLAGLTAADFTLNEDGENRAFTLLPDTIQGRYLLTFTTPLDDGASHRLTITANILGAPLSDNASYSRCFSSGVIELANNEVVSRLSGKAGSWLYFKINVPAGQDLLKVRLFPSGGARGDADLYLRYGALPTLTDYDLRPFTGGNEETAEITDPTSGDWFIGLYGVLDFRKVNLVASYLVQDINIQISELSAAFCPQIQIIATVEDQFGPLEGLGFADFAITENDTAPFQPLSAVHLGDGQYRIAYNTPNNDGGDISITLGVQDGSADSAYKNCARDGAVLDLRINPDHAAPAGDEILIPVIVSPVDPNLAVTSVELELTHDPNVITYMGFQTAGSLTQVWDFADDSGSTDGLIRLVLADVNQNIDGQTPIILESQQEDTLVYLRFGVIGLEGSCSDLTLHPVNTRFDDGNPLTRVTPGNFCVSDGCPQAKGDVNGDGDDDQAFDALQILNLISGLPTDYDPIPICVADTNCSGTISLIDAVRILQKNVELITDYCIDEPVTRGVDSFNVDIPENERTLAVGEPFEFTVNLTDVPDGDIFGYSFQLDYDPNYVTFQEVERIDTASARWAEPIVINENGILTVTNIYPLTAIEGTGALVKLTGTASNINTGATTITFTRFALATANEPEESFGPIPVTLGGEPCFNAASYFQAISQWNTTTDIRDLIQILDCPSKK